METWAERPRIQLTPPVISSRGDGCGGHECLVRGRGRVHAVSLSSSMSGERSMTVMECKGNRAIVKGERISFTKTEGLGVLRSRLQAVLTQESLLGKPPLRKRTMVQPSLSQGMKPPGNVSVGENYWNE